MLYILQFSNMALGMLTQGYKMRVLGVELVGLLGAGQYAANFFLIFLDFGFLLTAKKKISAISERLQELRKEVKLCDGIAERSGLIADTLSQVKAEEEKSQRKESRNYEQRR